MAKIEIEVPYSSRLKRTKVYTYEGNTFYGVWNPPVVLLDGDEKIVIIDEINVGQLDFLAYSEYGDRAFWWAIAYVNNIKFPMDEIAVGIKLILPKIEHIRAALSETVNG